MNCFVVSIEEDENPYFVATGLDGGNLTGLMWNGSSYSAEAAIPIRKVDDKNLRITHFYGLSEVMYQGVWSCAWHYLTKIVYAKIHLVRFLDATTQSLFNKKRLITKKRMDLLKFMMDDQLDRENDGIDVLSLMTKIYSMRLFLHPSWEAQERKVQLYLDSLVDSGDLRRDNEKYVVAGAAIRTLERYEEEERRHTEAVKLQWRMFWIAVIALVFALVQTGLVELPTILDFRE